MRKLSYFLIIAGILIASYPKLNDIYSSYRQQQLLKELEMNNQQQEAIIDDSYRQLNEVFEAESAAVDTLEEEEDTETEDNAEERQQEVKKPSIPVMGTIEIPKINLRLPVLEGTSKASLNMGAGHLTGTNLPGEIGNAAIAAHRGYSHGRLFNRLDELEIGDSITIQYSNSSYQYTVYETKIVEPTDTSVLNRNSKDKVLTLITCTPLYESTHRLIVHAVME